MVDRNRQLDISEQDADVGPTRHDLQRGVASDAPTIGPLEKTVRVRAQKLLSSTARLGGSPRIAIFVSRG